MRPEDVPKAIADQASDAYLDAAGNPGDHADYYVRAAIAAVWPLIAQAERERCAKVAGAMWADYRAEADRAGEMDDTDMQELSKRSTHDAAVAYRIASAIRALPDDGK